MNPLIIGAILALAKELPGLIAEAKRKGELTDEQAAAFRQEMQDSFASDHWKTDAQIAAEKPPTDPTPEEPPPGDEGSGGGSGD